MKMIMADTIDGIGRRQEKVSDCREMIGRCGANIGNVCFVDAISEQIRIEKEILCTRIEPENDEDLFILPASNWINENGKVLHEIFFRLAKSKVKLLVLGLGIQMGLNQKVSDFIKSLSDETITALRIMSDHSICIGIRGERTAEVLDKLSIHNWQVIGCPSFYEPYRKNQSVRLGNASCENICYNTRPGELREYKLMEMAVLTDSPIVLQAMSDLPLTLTEGKRIEQSVLDNRYPGSNLMAEQFENYIRKNGHIFFNRKEWSEYLVKSGVSFSVGGRFHGNMMAFSNGIPALWLVCDGRIKELVDAMRLPYIFYEELDHINEPEKFLEFLNYDKEFEKNYKKMAEGYVEFLNRNKVRHTFQTK